MTVRRTVVVVALMLFAAACSGEPPSLTAELDPGATAVPDPINPRVCNGVVSLAEQLVGLDATDSRRVDIVVDRSAATVSAVAVDAPAEVITMLTQLSLALSSPNTDIARTAARDAIAAEQGAAGSYLTQQCSGYVAGSLTGGLDATATVSAETRAAAIEAAERAADDDDAANAADEVTPQSPEPESEPEGSAGAGGTEDDAIPPVPDGVFEVSFAPLTYAYEGVEFSVTRVVRTVSEPAATLAATIDDDTPSGNWILVGVSFTGSPDASRSFDAGDLMLIDPTGTVLRASQLLTLDGSAGDGFTVGAGQVVERVAVFPVAVEVAELPGWSFGVGRSGQVPATRSLDVSGTFRYPIVVDDGGVTGTLRHADDECRESPEAPTLSVTTVQVTVSPEPWFVTGTRSALGTRHISVVANLTPSVVPAEEGPCAEIDLDIDQYPVSLLVDGVEVQSEVAGFGLSDLPSETTLVSAAFVVPYRASRVSLVNVDGFIIDDWVLNLAPEAGE